MADEAKTTEEETPSKKREPTPKYPVERYVTEALSFGLEPYIVQGAAAFQGWEPDEELTLHQVEDGIKKWLAAPVTNE